MWHIAYCRDWATFLPKTLTMRTMKDGPVIVEGKSYTGLTLVKEVHFPVHHFTEGLAIGWMHKHTISFTDFETNAIE
jgi:hypothetical protein